MIDKVSSWKFAEDFASEPEHIRQARLRAEQLGVETITPATGAQLAFLVSAIGAKSAVEAGTGAGVSSLWLLEGSEKLILTTIDSEPEYQNAAKQSFQEAGFDSSRVRAISGDAHRVMANMADAAYDLVFIDAEDQDIDDHLHSASRLLRPGGVVAFAHALFRDRVPDPAIRDEATANFRSAVRSFRDSDSFLSTLSMVGDGLLLASKRTIS